MFENTQNIHSTHYIKYDFKDSIVHFYHVRVPALDVGFIETLANHLVEVKCIAYQPRI